MPGLTLAIPIGVLLTALTLLPALIYMQGYDAGPLVGSPMMWLGLNAVTPTPTNPYRTAPVKAREIIYYM